MQVHKMESVNKAGQLMSLAALQQYDPYINKLLDVTGQVALYKFNSKANEWEKTDIEGTLFVYARSASPHHGFTIMNRLSTENLVEPINKDLEFQLQDPFLLYRNSNLGIYSIWFYDKADCQRIAQLMVQIVKQEALRAQHVSPDRGLLNRTNGCVDTKPIDILELLSKAKEEYHRSQIGEAEVSVNIDVNQNHDSGLRGSGESTEHTATSAPQEKPSHTVVKQITVEELFGSSLPKEPACPAPTAQNPTDPSQPEGFLRGVSYGPPPLPLEPLLTPRLTADPGGSDRPLAPGLVPLLQASGPRDPQSSVSPRLVAQSGAELPTGLGAPRGPNPGSQPTYMNPLKTDGHSIPMPGLAPSFLPSPLVTPQSFREPVPKPPGAFAGNTATPGQSKEMDTFSQPQSLVKPIPTVSMKAGLVVPGAEPSLLLSPSAFQNSSSKTIEQPRNPAHPPSPPATLGGDLPTALYSRNQLQDTLIHLIKNDPSFLNAIHEAYLQTLSKDLNNVKL
ncbi:mRNA-decapping enzyme 1A [Chanos chanos]|uniref:5'-(N(7)-methylguanosine 5'-triphospho)-[mRNA] hydrolase n=1 Tax=Chanos chanos TaxID=29144 RepID=A0A6J2WA52_CHACN|nr:mRNA-decapping enzyme 1A [Chanos chanos]